MRTTPIVAAAVIALFGAAASAQTSSPSSPGAMSPSAARPATQPQAPPAVNPLTKEDVSDIEGTTVYGSDDAKVGHISTVLMNPDSKKIDRLVVTTGGVLGVGGHRVAMPIEQFSWDSQKGGFKLSQTMANLKSMPEWVEGETTATGSSKPPKNATAPGSAGDGEKSAR